VQDEDADTLTCVEAFLEMLDVEEQDHPTSKRIAETPGVTWETRCDNLKRLEARLINLASQIYPNSKRILRRLETLDLESQVYPMFGRILKGLRGQIRKFILLPEGILKELETPDYPTSE
jgi:hypothetical protein